MTAIVDLPEYRIDAVETVYKGKRGRKDLSLDLRITRKRDGAFFLFEQSSGWSYELLWLSVQGDKGLADYAQSLIETVEADWGETLWERPKVLA